MKVGLDRLAQLRSSALIWAQGVGRKKNLTPNSVAYIERPDGTRDFFENGPFMSGTKVLAIFSTRSDLVNVLASREEINRVTL